MILGLVSGVSRWHDDAGGQALTFEPIWGVRSDKA